MAAVKFWFDSLGNQFFEVLQQSFVATAFTLPSSSTIVVVVPTSSNYFEGCFESLFQLNTPKIDNFSKFKSKGL